MSWIVASKIHGLQNFLARQNMLWVLMER
jgi:hypothetical protein